MHDPNDYTVTSRRTVLDGETVFEARVVELPDVVGYGETREEAESAAIESIVGLQELAKEMGQEFPAPNPVPTEYSGRVTLRMSRSLHRQVALLAHLEDVSQNQFINEAIAAHVAEGEARTSIIPTVGYYVASGGYYDATQVITPGQIVGDSTMVQVIGRYGLESFDPHLKDKETFATIGQSKRHISLADVKPANWRRPIEQFGDAE